MNDIDEQKSKEKNMESPRTTDGKKLYDVVSVVPRFPHQRGIFKDVQINWFIKHRDGDNEPPVPYEEAIVGYEQLSAARENSQEGTPEEAVRELFTEGEAEAFREYLLAVHNDDTATLEEVNLPLDDKHTWPLVGLHIVTPGPCDFHMLGEEPRYNLPFKVWGFYDVRDCECIEDPANPEPATSPKPMPVTVELTPAEHRELQRTVFHKMLPGGYGLDDIATVLNQIHGLPDGKLRKAVVFGPETIGLCDPSIPF